jgi:hypothetical protein
MERVKKPTVPRFYRDDSFIFFRIGAKTDRTLPVISHSFWHHETDSFEIQGTNNATLPQCACVILYQERRYPIQMINFAAKPHRTPGNDTGRMYKSASATANNAVPKNVLMEGAILKTVFLLKLAKKFGDLT